MDCELFSKIIVELLSDHDRVAVPGFGTFCAHTEPACFSDRGYTINPPYRKVSFLQECSDDSLLVDFYAGSNGKAERREAERVLMEFVSGLKDRVLSTKSVGLPGFGTLRATRDGKLFFVADENLAIFPSFDMLSPVSLRSTVPVRSEPLPALEFGGEPVEERSPVVQVEKKPERGFKALRAVIAVIVLLAVVSAVAIAVLGRTCPSIIEPLLYTPEEIEILHTQL